MGDQVKDWMALGAIDELIRRNGYAPTNREIGLRLGLRSTSSVYAILERLATRGLIVRAKASPRALYITDSGHRALSGAHGEPGEQRHGEQHG